ncbi:hypothetical protein SAY86_015145 [Trapa natans]|uniref:Uncharacterized protein n=1 Tax=Trapa natans TaxID=22666 RepID=A0AAN7KPQ4_TRANT|nr:hypothetical protein SAY86_015145 [Trapa natans]
MVSATVYKVVCLPKDLAVISIKSIYIDLYKVEFHTILCARCPLHGRPLYLGCDAIHVKLVDSMLTSPSMLAVVSGL